MAPTIHPYGPSIVLFDVEAHWQHPDLDFEYIATVAKEAAEGIEQTRDPDERQIPGGVEIAYQPGDGTFYGVVLVELDKLAGTNGRLKDGVRWEASAVRGLSYTPGAFLVSVIEHGSYPLRLGDRDPVAGSYIAEHWSLGATSALSIAILLRAISYNLEF